MSRPQDSIEPEAARPAPFLLVTGGKGGVGKTTIAANLGLALGDLGARPILVDLDFGLANLDIVLGTSGEHTVEEFLDGKRELERCLHAVSPGTRLLSAGSGSYRRGRASADRSTRLLAALESLSAGVVVGDSPAGIGDEVLDFAVRAQRVLVVTTPEPAAVMDAYGVLKAIDAYALDTGVEVPTPEVFVNFARDAREAESIATKLRAVCERFLARSPRLLGWMPRTRAVLRAVTEQRPFVLHAPASSAAKSMKRLAGRYSTLLDPSRCPISGTKALVTHGR